LKIVLTALFEGKMFIKAPVASLYGFLGFSFKKQLRISILSSTVNVGCGGKREKKRNIKGLLVTVC